MDLFMTNNQLIVQILNSLRNEYKFQMLLLEKLIRYQENLLTIDELTEELSLRYERLSMQK
jgi:hypothetical protein